MLTPASFRAHVAELGARFRAAIDPASLAAPIVACPGWRGQDLVEHLGRVHAMAVARINGTFTGRGSQDLPGIEGADPASWYQERLDAMVARFASLSPDDEVPTFLGPRPGQWWFRRQANEMAVHLWDLECATGVPSPVDPALAADGIDELIGLFWPLALEPGTVGAPGQSIHPHCTDVDGEWLLRFTDEGFTVSREHAKGDVAVRGTASDLFVTLWGRQPLTQPEVFGDAVLLGRLLAAARI